MGVVSVVVKAVGGFFLLFSYFIIYTAMLLTPHHTHRTYYSLQS